MAEDKKRWKRFQYASFDRKQIARRMKKAEKSTIRHARKFVVGRWENLRTSRRHIIAWLVLVAVLIGAVVAQYLWFQRDYQTEAQATGGTYAEATYGEIQTLNPLYAVTRSEKAVQKLVFSSLYRYDATGRLQADLATNISIAKDNKTFNVTLRSDVKWHDGQPLTAKDVVFTVNLMKNPEARSELESTFRAVTAKAIDDTTVQFRLATPYAAFQHAMTFAILPSHILENVGPGLLREHGFSYAPIGSGPFTFRLLQNINVERGEKTVHLVANEQYYAGRPYLNRFEVHSYGSREAVADAIRQAEVNATTDTGDIDISGIDTSNYKVSNVPVDNGVYALFNTTSPILKDSTVRKALQVGTDTTALRAEVGGEVKALSLPFIDGQIGENQPKLASYNLEQARKLLNDRGWKLSKGSTVRQKDKTPLTLNLVTVTGSRYERAAKVLQEQWAELGVDVDVTVIDPASIDQNFTQDTLRPRAYDVLVYELAIGADLDAYAYWHSSQANEMGYNFTNYNNVTADEAIVGARITSSLRLRIAKDRAFAVQWVKDVPAIGLFQQTVPYIHTHSIHSYDDMAQLVSVNDQYYNVTEWYMATKSVYKTP